MKRAKVTIVGAGNVGATLAQALARTDLVDLSLIETAQAAGMAAGKALDIQQAGAVLGYSTRLAGGDDWALATEAQVIVVTAGVARKPGMSRDDLLAINAKIVAGAAREAARRAPEAVAILVSNPLDAMCEVFQRASGFPLERVIGMAGVLDSARMRTFVAGELGISPQSVQACVLGGHGDTMVPLPRCSTAAGAPLTDLLSPERLEAVIERTRNGGAEIVKLLESGSAFYAPAASAAEMVESIILDQKKVLPCAVRLRGEYGVEGLFIGVPAVLGARGVERVIEIPLTAAEADIFKKSVAAVQTLVQQIDGMGVV